MWEKSGTDIGASSDEKTNRSGDRSLPFSAGRRDYLRLTGAGLAALGGVGFGASSVADVATAAPLDPTDWQLSFEDDFSSGSLDSSTWSPGYGWGRTSNNHDGVTKDANIAVSGGNLRLAATNPNGGAPYHVGAVNTKNKLTIDPDPGVYVEARMKCPDLPGSLPAFWSKPNSEAWPPEIDFMEAPYMSGGGGGDYSTHHIHWNTSAQPGDGSTHRDWSNGSRSLDPNEFHTYGCEWRTDRIVHYVNGTVVGTCTDGDVLRSVNAGAPFYIMFWLGVGHDWPGNPPGDWSGYDTVMDVDYFRAYEYAPGSGGGGDGGDGGTGDRHYLWARSDDGNRYEFAFETSGGNISLDSSGSQAEYWIADDGTTAGGTTDKTDSLPGFWYYGDVTSLLYRGSIELFIDDQPVDRSTVGTYAPNTITFDGRNGRGSYEATVTGRIAKSEASGASVNPNDAVSGPTVTGRVDGGVDSYLFSGEIESIDADRSISVLVNGDEYDSSKRVEVSRVPDSSGRVDYIIESNGEMSELTGIGSTDAAAGSKARGTVTGGIDTYQLTNGEVTDVSTFGGNVVVTVDGNEWSE